MGSGVGVLGAWWGGDSNDDASTLNSNTLRFTREQEQEQEPEEEERDMDMDVDEAVA